MSVRQTISIAFRHPDARPTALDEFDASPLKSVPDRHDMARLAHARLEIGDD